MRKFSYIVQFLASICFVVGLTACNDKQETSETQTKVAKGGRYYGGTFRLNETEYIKSLFPPSIVDVYSYRVATQIFEGLFKFDTKTLEVVHSLAESYVPDETRTIYTIKIKKGVKFHNDPCFEGGVGRELNAKDVEYVFKRLATRSSDNKASYIFDGVIKGFSEYYQASAENGDNNGEIEGVKVIDDYTIQFHLIKPNALFLAYLARVETLIYPREAYEKYGVDMRIHPVGTGPFVFSNVDEERSIILKRSDNYYGKDQYGNQLPFLDAIQVHFIKEKKMELFEFRKKKLDMIYRIPTDYIIEIIDEDKNSGEGKLYDLQREPEMQSQMLVFMNKSKVFADVNVRKAFSFAVDREIILDKVLLGEGYAPGHHGVTPPSFREQGYSIDDVRGYSFSQDSARFYLAKAGYPNGKGFPTIFLDYNADGDRYTNVVVEVQKQLKEVLNINVDLALSPMNQIAEKATNGTFELVRMAWVADFPSPESFVRMFYSKDMPTEIGQNSFPNVPRYVNPKFDEYYEKAMNATSIEEAIKYFKTAENIAMEDAPVIVLWYDEGYRLIQRNVKNFPNNPMQYRDFSEVYFEPENAAAQAKK